MASSVLLLCAALLAGAAAAPGAHPEPDVVLVNGLWFDGERFVPRDVRVRQGRLDFEGGPGSGRIVDLEGGWVVPPFADAHTHGAAFRHADTFLSHGIYYVKVQGVSSRLAAAARPWFARSDTLDAALSFATLTASGGHPTEMGPGQPGVRGAADLEGNWVHTLDSVRDLEDKWARILAPRPDFLKAFLLNSDEHASRAADPSVGARYRGLDPALLHPIVRRAHGAGLRVSAHVRTAVDFRVAVAAGVDEIAHLPGYSIGPAMGDRDDPRLLAELDDRGRFLLADRDARAAAAAGVVVVTTVGGPLSVPEGLPPDIAALFARSLETHLDVQRHNLALLHRHGVALAVGWDRDDGSAVDEARYLLALGVFDAGALLVMWTRTTAGTIFPERRIGRLAHGYEASFLVLEGNPLVDFEAVTRIRMRFKGGELLPAR